MSQDFSNVIILIEMRKSYENLLLLDRRRKAPDSARIPVSIIGSVYMRELVSSYCNVMVLMKFLHTHYLHVTENVNVTYEYQL